MKPTGKGNFLDDVVDEMGDDKGGTKYGADMADEGDDTDDEQTNEDRIMAAAQVGKALGLPNVDKTKLAEALKTFIATC